MNICIDGCFIIQQRTLLPFLLHSKTIYSENSGEEQHVNKNKPTLLKLIKQRTHQVFLAVEFS